MIEIPAVDLDPGDHVWTGGAWELVADVPDNVDGVVEVATLRDGERRVRPFGAAEPVRVRREQETKAA